MLEYKQIVTFNFYYNTLRDPVRLLALPKEKSKCEAQLIMPQAIRPPPPKGLG